MKPTTSLAGFRPRWQGADSAERLPHWGRSKIERRGRRRKAIDSPSLDITAQWSEDWREYHSQGLECIVMSGRFASGLFGEPARAGADQAREAFRGGGPEARWISCLVGQFLAGTGAEILLKGLYLKNGYSIRSPEDPQVQTLARIEAPEARAFNPYVSASFDTLLLEHNLKLLGETQTFRPLVIAKSWRDRAAHTAMTSGGDTGVPPVMLGMALCSLHDALLENAGREHERRIRKILLDSRRGADGSDNAPIRY